MNEKPHNLEAEKSVLCCILLDNRTSDGDRVWDTCQQKRIVPESFFDERNREIYEAMQSLVRQSKPIDHLTLREELKVRKTLDFVGGYKYLIDLIDQTPTTAHAEHYIHIVSELHIRRRLIDCATRILQRAYANDVLPAFAHVSDAQRDILELDATGETYEPWSATTDTTSERLGAMIDGERPEGLPTGLTELDNVLLGLKPSEMIVIGARPSVGKTALAMSIAEHLAIDKEGEKVPVLVFSLEMNREALNERMLIGRAGLDRWDLRKGRYAEDKAKGDAARERLAAAKSAVRAAPIFVVDRSDTDIMQIRSIARRKVRHEHVGLVIIDYLTLCHYRDLAATQSRYQEVSLISNHIKAMAKELNVPVIVLSQLSRKTSDRGGAGENAGRDGYEEPKMSDLRESGSIEQDADVVLLLNKTRDMPANNGEKLVVETINIAKNRNGATGKVEVCFNPKRTRFESLPKEAQLVVKRLI